MKSPKINCCRMTFAMLSIVLVSACQDVVFLPTKGEIIGSVVDNNDRPLGGIPVTALHFPPTQSGQAEQRSVSVLTDGSGTFQIAELWDEVYITVQQLGYQPLEKRIEIKGNSKPRVDIVLVGSPTLTAVELDRHALTNSQSDTIEIIVDAIDVYNSNPRSYAINVLILNSGGTAVLTKSTSPTSPNIHRLVSRTSLYGGELEIGRYQIAAEIIDSDKLVHSSVFNQFIDVSP